jgi:tryptophanyl-tRNA synthetase
MNTYTDPTRKHAIDPGHIEGNMVFAYLDFFGEPQRVSDLKSRYVAGKVSDVEVKEYLFTALMDMFKTARERYIELKADPKKVKSILEEGALSARSVAGETMTEVRQAVGLTTTFSFS